MSSIRRASLLAALGGLSALATAQLPPTHCPLVGHDVVQVPHQAPPGRTPYGGQSDSALVLYDSTSSFGWAGDLYAQMLTNYLTHFDRKITMEAVENYKSGDIKNYGSAWYLGFVYQDPLPAAFLNDVMADTKPFVWCGFNLWELAWLNNGYQSHNPAFVAKTGIEFMGLDESGYPSVVYNGTTLVKDQLVPTEGVVQVVNPKLASVAATSVNASGGSVPYITNAGGNFWYVADNPFMDYSFATLQDRQIAFGDVIHTVLNDGVKPNHRAFIRIEDVSAYSDPTQLRALADTLYANKVPFEVCVIPDWRDPNGVYFNGVATELRMDKSPKFVEALQYMQSKGGQIIMHGYTHQYSNVENAWTGVSADDFEFWRTDLNAAGALTYVGPIPEDSKQWVHQRMVNAFSIMWSCGFFPTGWNTPHYGASPTDYNEFSNDFSYALDREMVFSNINPGGGTMYYLNEFVPYTYKDEYGMFRIPETCGYVVPSNAFIVGPSIGAGSSMPADLIARAQANLACRDGWAGCYYHWFLGTTYLQELVQGIQGLGYTFVTTSRFVDSRIH